MEVAYYPGCSLHSAAREYDMSTRLVCRHLGISLKEIKDWNCCGATAAHSLDHLLAVSLGARNLALLDGMKMTRVTSPCANCYSRLKAAAHELQHDEILKTEVERILEAQVPCGVEVLSLLEMFVTQVGIDTIAENVSKPLKGLKLAAYYGCLLTRPSRISGFDDPEQPVSMDRLLESLGAETVDWSHKAECCGAGFTAAEVGIVLDLGGQVLEAARQAGAEALVVACPMCQLNLDTRQGAIEANRGTRYDLPVMYFTQLMGLAFGYSPRVLGLKRLLTSPFPLLKTKGLL